MATVELTALLRSATQRLAEAGCSSPAPDAAALLGHAVGCDPAEVHRRALLGHAVDADGPEVAALEDGVARRAAREPLQHVLGYAWFAGARLTVGPGVFVPRPETELLVERAGEILASRGEGRVQVELVDLCTGSGAVVLGVAAAVERRRQAGERLPELVLRAVEIDHRAAEYAERNIESTGMTVDLRVSDARVEFADREGQADLVVSNPPYVPDGAVPDDPEVADHDPERALYGGSPDGLAVPLQLARHAATLLRPGGWLLMEHDDTQGESLPRLLGELGYVDVVDHRDLAGRPRFVEGRWPGR
ncbi:peptide chain release factor N(5)-glutamine methyltransferase [Kytococcus schroeteri]|uniref:peptide chain release factor N(5)-glutamine methyltransferase n=1 Tax=Kytococcus schroeteri TaxID=138300 RepID=UPI001EE27889|nr:peptide chain release factor N(5)-glutamine methyltransferase [Kytococcus schroeteri]